MKKLSSSLLSCISICLLLLASFQAKADRAAAGEVGYTFVRVDSTIKKIDSTIIRVDTTKSPSGAVTKLDTVYRRDTTYNYADVYKLTYKFYKDCGGATPEPATVQLCYYNTCNTDRGFVVLAKKTPLSSNGLPMAYSCAGVSTTTCNGGTIRGYKEWIYEGQVSLPSRCASWHLWVSIGSRNNTITNYVPPVSSNNLYTEATLNNADAHVNSSPTFSLAPIQYMCNNVKQDFTFTAVDPDGDILTYSLIDPATANDNQTTCPAAPGVISHTFGGAYPGGPILATNPFSTGNTFILNGSTGEMSFTPTAGGDQLAQLCLLVTKTRGTKVVGSVMREMQFVISHSCSASSPLVFTQNPVKAVLPVAPDTNLVCPNFEHEICFDLTSSDPGTSIFISGDNHLTFSKTASTSTMSAYTGQYSNSVSGCFTWTPDTVDEGTKYLIINSTICKPGTPTLYRKDTIKIFTVYTVHASKDDTICLYENTTLCVIGGALDSFEWAITNPAGSGITTGTLGIATPNDYPCTVVTPGNTTSYLVTCKDRYNGCKRADIPALNTNQDEVKVVLVNPIINAGPDTTMCTYSTLQLNANLLNPQPELTYSYRWTPSLYLDDSTIINPTIKIPAGTAVEDIPDSIVYYIRVTPSLTRCAREDTVTVYILKGFYILTGDSLGDVTGYGYKGRQQGFSDTAICQGQSVRMVGWVDSKANRKYDLSWTPSTGVSTPNGFATGMTITPPSTTTYTLTAQKSGCPKDSVKKVTIRVDPIPTADIGPDRTICFGDTINVFATITPDPDVFTDYTYDWSPGGAFARPDTFITFFTGFVTQNIRFTVKTPAGCTGTDNAVFKVEARKFLTVSPADTMICPGDQIKLHVKGDKLLDKILWKPAARLDTATSLNPTAFPEYNTDYVVVGIDSNKCVDSAIVKVAVFPRAVIYLEDTVTIYPGEVYQMNPEGNGLYYSWFPAVGLDYANIANPKASPLLNTTYYITTKTEAGCTAYDSVHVFVAPDSYVDIPNAFVPGNGENSKFKILHLGDANLLSFTIYNRWGNKMFETKDINEGWDGTFGGQPQSLGVYVYVIEAVTARGNRIMKQGNVTLIR